MNPGVLQSMFTESDNVTHDLYRYLSLATICVALGLEVYAVTICNKAFDTQTFGIGMGSLFVGMGVALKMKQELRKTLATAP